MRHLDEYRNADLVQSLVSKLWQATDRPLRIMEVCGTHTMAIFRHGIRDLIPPGVTLVSGPGCPVCVTPQGYIDEAARLAREQGVILGTFGDMLRVPGRQTSLLNEKAAGCDVRVLYSPLDALDIAAANPDKQVVFLGIGFETTAPVTALAIQAAAARGLGNFSVFSAHKRVPPVMKTLAADTELQIDGFLCPGHVCTVIGLEPFRFLAEAARLPAVVAGFEAADILHALVKLAEMFRQGRPELVNGYPRAVTAAGNRQAQNLLAEVFAVTDSVWRGIGRIPESGWVLRPKYAGFDAAEIFGIGDLAEAEMSECICGDILTGRKLPVECTLYQTACTPQNPQGACMVSGEGTCAAYYRYHNG